MDTAATAGSSSTGTGADTSGAMPTGATSTSEGTGASTTTTSSTGDASITVDGTTLSAETTDTEPPPSEVERCVLANLPIPDDDATGVTSPIELLEDGTVVDLRVAVQANHPYVGDLAFALIKDEATLTVIDAPMLCSGNDVDVLLHDEARATIDASCLADGQGTPALGGELLPESPLGPVFGGSSVAGTWQLRATDANMLDSGTLTQWCLYVTYR